MCELNLDVDDKSMPCRRCRTTGTHLSAAARSLIRSTGHILCERRPRLLDDENGSSRTSRTIPRCRCELRCGADGKYPNGSMCRHCAIMANSVLRCRHRVTERGPASAGDAVSGRVWCLGPLELRASAWSWPAASWGALRGETHVAMYRTFAICINQRVNEVLPVAKIDVVMRTVFGE